MLIGGYIHQFNQHPERTIPDLARKLKSNGLNHVLFKATQWLTWTGRWESGGASDIENLDAVKRTVDAFDMEGIDASPWVVPMFLQADGNSWAYDEDTVRAEVERMVMIANVADKIDFDIEPYDEFAPNVAAGDYRAITPFFKLFRERVGEGVEITVDSPVRNSAHEWGKISPVLQRCAPFIDRVALQSYFGIEQAREAETRVRSVVGSRVAIDHIVDTDDQNLRDMLAWKKGAERLYIWRAVDMDQADANSLHTITGPTEPTTKVVPKPITSVTRQGQFECQNYDTVAECILWQSATCQSAVVAEFLTAHGEPCNITEGKQRILDTGEDITVNDGLMNNLGQTVGIVLAINDAELVPNDVPLKVSRNHYDSFDRNTIMAVLDSGRPIIVQLNKYWGKFGHYVVLTHTLPNRDGVEIVDSNAGSGQRTRYYFDRGDDPNGRSLWDDMGGGTDRPGYAIWANEVEGDMPDSNEEELKKEIETLNGERNRLINEIGAKDAEIQALREKNNHLITAVAHIGDVVTFDTMQKVIDTLVSAQMEAMRIRLAEVGPRPA